MDEQPYLYVSRRILKGLNELAKLFSQDSWDHKNLIDPRNSGTYKNSKDLKEILEIFKILKILKKFLQLWIFCEDHKNFRDPKFCKNTKYK